MRTVTAAVMDRGVLLGAFRVVAHLIMQIRRIVLVTATNSSSAVEVTVETMPCLGATQSMFDSGEANAHQVVIIRFVYAANNCKFPYIYKVYLRVDLCIVQKHSVPLCSHLTSKNERIDKTVIIKSINQLFFCSS